MKSATFWTKVILSAVLAVVVTLFATQTYAADLPLAAASPLTGVAFDDRPLLLPVQRNFQMAMLTASSEMGRSCGKMEAYGWRMSQTEQARVNQIFNNTVDRMRMTGYAIAPQKLTSLSSDITLFTADRPDKHFIFLWSAGELGLVMTLCETSAPLPVSQRPQSLVPSVQTFPVPMDVVSSGLDALGKNALKDPGNKFTPVGEWIGGYTCAQGYTGGTLKILHMKGQDFDGEFKFYPTPRNPTVPAGAYTVFGEYDPDSKRILINPGKWIQRPRNFYNTVIVGSFDAARDTFSAYFQGINGCTSFEAKRAGEPYVDHVPPLHKKLVKKKKKIVKKPTSAPVTQTDLSPIGTAPVVAPLLAPAAVAPATAPSSPALPKVPSLQPTGPTAAAPPAAPVITPPTVPSAPSLPADDKSPDGITLTAPSK
jgi:hypothetical protein